jgi:hypothetical protein
MIQIKLKDKRLSNRWELMVRYHMRVASPQAAGVIGLPDGKLEKSFAVTQGTWRFLNNDRVTFEELIVPLQDFARIACASVSAPFVLVAHDWSKLSYPGQKCRQDLAQLSSSSDVGYELACALAINPDDGLPIAPLEMHLKTAKGMLSTRGKVEVAAHTDQVMATMNASASWNLGKPIVHVIDREADSVGHFRDWSAAGHKFLVRGDERRVLYQDTQVKLSDVSSQLEAEGRYQSAGTVLHENRPLHLEIAEAEVTLYRPARKNSNGVRTDIPGVPLPVRLVLTRLIDDQKQVLKHWYLLSNVPTEWADAKMLAKCYYWRWKIETYFKLLKSSGTQIEAWQQETAEAIFRRLLVASMAMVTVWHLMATNEPKTNEFKKLLMSLSGRQTKRSRPFTAPGLLAGLWSYFSMMSILEKYDLNSLKEIAKGISLPISLFDSG